MAAGPAQICSQPTLTTTATTGSISYPVGIGAGDLVFLAVTSVAGLTGTPAGWTSIANNTNVSTNLSVYARLASAPLSGSITLTGSSASEDIAATMWVVHGEFTSVAANVLGAVSNTANAAAITATAMSVPIGALLFSCCAQYYSSNTVSTCAVTGTNWSSIASLECPANGVYYEGLNVAINSTDSGKVANSAVFTWTHGTNLQATSFYVTQGTVPTIAAGSGSQNTGVTSLQTGVMIPLVGDVLFATLYTSVAVTNLAAPSGAWQLVSGGGSGSYGVWYLPITSANASASVQYTFTWTGSAAGTLLVAQVRGAAGSAPSVVATGGPVAANTTYSSPATTPTGMAGLFVAHFHSHATTAPNVPAAFNQPSPAQSYSGTNQSCIMTYTTYAGDTAETASSTGNTNATSLSVTAAFDASPFPPDGYGYYVIPPGMLTPNYYQYSLPEAVYAPGLWSGAVKITGYNSPMLGSAQNQNQEYFPEPMLRTGGFNGTAQMSGNVEVVGVAYPNATVLLYQRKGGVFMGSTLTDAYGNYVFYGLKPGTVYPNNYFVVCIDPTTGCLYGSLLDDDVTPA